MQGQAVDLSAPQLPGAHSSLTGRAGRNRLLFHFSDQSHLAPAQPPFRHMGFGFWCVIIVILCHVGMTADSGCRDGWWGSVPGSRFMAESMGSRESSCSPELLLPGEINQMCPALAGKFSLPQELMLRCSFPLSFWERFSAEHLSPPQQTATPAWSCPRKSVEESVWCWLEAAAGQCGGCCTAQPTLPLHNPLGCSSS